MSAPRTLDVSTLPESGFSTESPVWWGTLGFMCIEGTSLALCAATYLYLSRRADSWPPAGTSLPDLVAPTIFLVLAVASIALAFAIERSAKGHDLPRLRRLLLYGVIAEVVLVVVRALEFYAINTRWDTTAYGSIVWFTLGLHTTLLIFDLLETAGFALLFKRGPIEQKHFADAADAAAYWYFVVLAWIPTYALLYLYPRFTHHSP
jgi:cytochrome c oxidase subunit III